ncbi:MAG: MBL fold metallo-hydrolase [Planctomycetaceae bacterium]|nr:MBL fold metallo-hydrolase [Planctomycetaceae bacterium]
MLERKPLFPNVIELNYQAGSVFGCNVYLIYDEDEWVLIDIGYEEVVNEVVDIIRGLDFPFSKRKALIASHADVDHIQGLSLLKQAIKAPVAAHPLAAVSLRKADKLKTFAQIEAQGIDLPLPPVEVEQLIDDGDKITIGNLELEVWLTPGHTDSQLSFRLGDLLFSGDNIYRDGCVGAIDAHHGSDLDAFISSLLRIRASDVKWLLPSHGPIFRKDEEMLDKTISRLESYRHMADFGTCASDWPLMDEWEREVAEGKLPT